MMAKRTTEKERVLVVENDPLLRDQIARQALGTLGLDIQIAEEASAAIQKAITFQPDIIIANLELPGLSGKDLLTALAAQSIDVPVIMVAEKGKERDVIQTFRLGASDYVSFPIREAEVVSAVERALQTTRARKERQTLQAEIQRKNQELRQRVDELTTIFGVGKTVAQVANQQETFEKLAEGAAHLAKADYSWVLLQNEHTKKFALRAQHNLPKSLSSLMGQPWEDDTTSLVALSGESLSAHGEAIKRFKLKTAALGQSILITPVKVRNQTIALLVVMRKADQEFGRSDQIMLEAIADYAAISLINSRLFQALDERGSSASLPAAKLPSSEGEKVKDDLIQNASVELRKLVTGAADRLDKVISGDLGDLNNLKQLEAVEQAHHSLEDIADIANAMTLIYAAAQPQKSNTVSLNAITEQCVQRFENQADRNHVLMNSAFPIDNLKVMADSSQLSLAIDAMISNAIKFNKEGGQVMVTLEKVDDHTGHLIIQDTGVGIDKTNMGKVFDRFVKFDGQASGNTGGLGIGLALTKEIVTAHGGKVWVESEKNKGSIFHIALPLSN